MTQSVSANNPGGIAPGNTYKVRFALRDTILNRYTYGPFTTFTTPAALTAPSQPSITLITPTTNTLAINWSTPASNGGAPISQYWAYVESAPAGATVGYCSTTGARTCTVSGLLANTTYYVIVSAWNTVDGVNRSSGDQFSPRTTTKTLATPAAVLVPEVVINSGTLTSGVLAGSIAPGGSFGISWRVINNDQISSTVALIDGNGNSASFVGGALVSGTVQDGTYQGSLSVPAGFTAGRYLICAIAISSTNKRSASQCGSRSEYVKVAELQVNTAWTPPADSSTPIYDDTYTRICLTQNWTACGSWTIHDAAGTVVNRLVGPVPFTFCQTSGVNVCSGTPKGYAVLVGRYYAPTPVVAGLQAIAIPEGVPSNSVKIGSNVMASFRATDGLGIANAWVRVWKSTENSLQGFGEGTYTANLISGTNIDGTYQATIVTTIPGYAQGGTFTVGVQIGGNNRITGWIAIGSFTLVP
jgi:hypothetical protein